MKVKIKNTVLILIVFVLGMVVSFLFLFGNGMVKINERSNNSLETSGTNKVKNQNITLIDSNFSKGITQEIILDDNSKAKLYVDKKNIKLNDKNIHKFEVDDDISNIVQVSVYDDIIIAMVDYSLNQSMLIYDFEGGLLKEINLFIDEVSRIFSISSKYSNDKYFAVNEFGNISILGTKIKSDTNKYLVDTGYEIDLCSNDNELADEEIASGIFEFSYLGNGIFSEIIYSSVKEVVKDVRKCS